MKWINPTIKPGEKHKVITGIPGKTGIVYTLDRRTGQFLWATPTIYQNVVAKIDGRTGEATVEPSALFKAKGDEATVCPSIHGGKNWPAGAYSPLTGNMYFPLQNTCSHYTVTIASRKEPSSYGLRSVNTAAPGTTNVGSIHAISVSTGRTAWKFEQRAALLSLADDRRRIAVRRRRCGPVPRVRSEDGSGAVADESGLAGHGISDHLLRRRPAVPRRERRAGG